MLRIFIWTWCLLYFINITASYQGITSCTDMGTRTSLHANKYVYHCQYLPLMFNVFRIASITGYVIVMHRCPLSRDVGVFGVFVSFISVLALHDDVIKWKHFPHYWSFVRGIHWSPVNSPHKGQWHGALMFSLICARINGWVNNPEADNSRCHLAHFDVIVMDIDPFIKSFTVSAFSSGWLRLLFGS